MPGVRLLVRSAPGEKQEARSEKTLPTDHPSDWRLIRGDLTESGAWRSELQGVDTVVHLAAQTGKASKASHLRVNRDATADLLAAAKAAGARRFLFVSSIAAGFADQRHYHYARAKAEAEKLVETSGLDRLILRPTMIFGPGSPAQANLLRLALLPIPVLFGAGAPIQPIHVDDLAAAIVAALGVPSWPSGPVELGGPEIVQQEELIRRFRRAAGKPDRSPIRIPLELVRSGLALIEPIALAALPFTAGQLAAFANPSVARPHPFVQSLPPARRGLDQMIAG